MRTLYRVGIVGLSGIASAPPVVDLGAPLGHRHAMSHASAYAERPDVEVVAVCDLNTDLADQFQSRWHDRWPSVIGYTDVKRMLAEAKVDVLSVCTGDHLHADIVVAAAKASVRGILCEKPIATTLADADKMIEAVNARGTVMVIDHTRRWVPEFVAARRLVQSGELGTIRSVETLWYGPRAMLFRNGTHFVDAMLYLAGGAPEWVVAHHTRDFADYGPRYAGDGGKDPRFDPASTAVFQLSTGVRGVYHFIEAEAGFGEIRVVGDAGVITLRQDGAGTEHAEWMKLDEAGRAFRRPLTRDHYAFGSVGGAVNELIGLLDGSITQPTSPPEEARKTLSLLLGMLQSHHLQRKVHFPVADM